MKHLLFALFLGFSCFSCSKNTYIGETEHLRSKAFKSQEFKELKNAYKNYLRFGKSHNTITAMIRLKDDPHIKDTIHHYKVVRDSLLDVAKEKSTVFYTKYPSDILKLEPTIFIEKLKENQ